MAKPTKWGSEFLVNTITDGNQEWSNVARLADGRFVATWEDWGGSLGDNSLTGVHGQIFNADGSKSGAEFLVNTTTLGHQWDVTTTGLADGRFIVTWLDESKGQIDT